MDYIEKMLFNFAWKLNNYRKFESDEDMFKLIEEFLTEYDPYNQPERSKREDVFVIKGTSECIALDATPSEECREYHKNSYIQINGQLRRCGALNTVETQ